MSAIINHSVLEVISPNIAEGMRFLRIAREASLDNFEYEICDDRVRFLIRPISPNEKITKWVVLGIAHQARVETRV